MAIVSDLLQLCRLCLVKDEVNVPIFEGESDDQQISLKISSCLPVTLSQDDRLPQKICSECCRKLDTLYEFRNSSVNAEKQLVTWLEELENQSKKTSEKMSIATESLSEKTIVKEEIDEVDENGALSNEAEDYILQQQVAYDKTDLLNDAADETGEPQPKRAKRAAALKALIHTQESEEDEEDIDEPEPITKAEEESEPSETDINESVDDTFAGGPSTSADDQPGPSGVGKSTEGPSINIVDIEEGEGEIGDVLYKCGMCQQLFASKNAFLAHHMSEQGDIFVCCKCGLSFKTSSELYDHYNTHKEYQEIEEEEVEEIVMDYGENFEISLPNQAITDNNEVVYILDDSQCENEVVIEEGHGEISDRMIQRAEALKILNLEHGYMVKKPQPKAPTIVTTSKKVTTPTKSRVPVRRPHVVPDFSSTSYAFMNPNDEIDIAHYKCERCEQIFISKMVFFRHIEKGKCYINNCDVCTASFSKNSEFYNHYLAEHTDRAICNFCFRTFMYEKNVKEHMLRHLDQFRHRCEVCSKGFYTVREYRNHYKNRHMGIRHKCEVCSRTFADEYYFKRHIATHAQKKVSFTVTSV